MTNSDKTESQVGWANLFTQYYKLTQKFWLGGAASNDFYSQWWSFFMDSANRYQQILQDFNERLLQASGYPTRDDISRVNRQLYALSNQLDDVESQMSGQLVTRQAENSTLKDKVAALQAEIDRLRAELADIKPKN